MKIEQDNIHSFEYLKNCSKDFIVSSILDNYSEDEKKEILRKVDFINMMDSNSLNIIVNSISFTSAFNMLQNKLLIDKVSDINIKFCAKESIFIKDFLSLIPINKINHDMLKNMIKNFNKEDIILYFRNKDIINQLTIKDIIDISIIKRIDLINDIYLIELFNDNEVYEYVDRYFRNTLDYKIIDNPYVKNILFDNDIDLDETRYLYDYLTTQNNHSIKDINHSLKAFIKVNSLYEEYGLENTINMFNTKGITIDDIFTFKKKKDNKKKLKKSV